MECPRGHILSVVDGRCAACNRERQAAHRRRAREARKFVMSLQERRVPLDVELIVEAHNLLKAVDLARHPRISN